MRPRFPNEPAEMTDFRRACEKYILPGYAPEAPIFARDAKVVTAGSCFARHIAAALNSASIPTFHVHYTEEQNSPAATNILVRETLAGASGPKWQARLAGADLFILTVGVAIAPFIGSEPVLDMNKANVKEMEWRMLMPDQIASYTHQIIAQLRAANPDMTIVLTESPLPLNKAVGHRSVFGQDCVSKSCIRVGLELVMQAAKEGVYYWPSFEMVRWLAPHRGQAFGIEDADNRHIPTSMVDEITAMFIETYFRPVAEAA